MEHLLLKAVTTATDEGTFEAVISAATVDREKDIVDPAGMVRALQKWIATGKKIPLAWNHSTKPEDQIGYIDPSTARAVGSEVWVKGWIDQSSEVGAHAWRLVKVGTLGFSFGYMTLKSEARRGGGRHLKELDVFEVTASPTPMNNDTRVVSWKSLPADEDQRKRATRIEREAEENRIPAVKQVAATPADDAEDEDDPAELLGQMLSLAQDFIDDEPDPADADAMRQIAKLLLILAGQEAEEGPEDAPKSAAELRRQADATTLEHTVDREQEREAARVQRAEQKRAKALLDLFPEHETEAVLAGDLKAVWTADYLKGLPDSAFLHERRFAYKDASGTVDVPHLRYAMERIPTSEFSQDVKDKLAAKAASVLDAHQKSVDGAAQARVRAVDPLRAKADALALEHASGGMSLQKPPRPAKQAPIPDLVPLKELKQRMRAEMLTALSGGTET